MQNKRYTNYDKQCNDETLKVRKGGMANRMNRNENSCIIQNESRDYVHGHQLEIFKCQSVLPSPSLEQ